MKLNYWRLKFDWEYIYLNRIVNRIPCWSIRRTLYRKRGMQIGTNARIGIGTVVVMPSKIKIGARTTINENCFLDGRGGLSIGRNTSISVFTKIISASHKEEDFEFFSKKTVIGNRVWIGTGAIVLDGSKLADYTVLGAGAVFKGSSESGDVLIGNPARRIRKRKGTKKYQLQYNAYFR